MRLRLHPPRAPEAPGPLARRLSSRVVPTGLGPPALPRVGRRAPPALPAVHLEGRPGAWFVRGPDGVEHPVDPADPDALHAVAHLLLERP